MELLCCLVGESKLPLWRMEFAPRSGLQEKTQLKKEGKGTGEIWGFFLKETNSEQALTSRSSLLKLRQKSDQVAIPTRNHP